MADTVYLYVEMPDGTYRLPAVFIAENRAAYMASHDNPNMPTSDLAWQQTFNDERSFAMKDEEELIDWAHNNLNWSDVKEHARKVDDLGGIDWEEHWANGRMWIKREE
jgi:hypothetical protein